jgi:hypothetical protein
MLRAASHRIDDQLQAILRYASKRSRAKDGSDRSEVNNWPPPDIVPQKGNRPEGESGGAQFVRLGSVVAPVAGVFRSSG